MTSWINVNVNRNFILAVLLLGVFAILAGTCLIVLIPKGIVFTVVATGCFVLGTGVAVGAFYYLNK